MRVYVPKTLNDITMYALLGQFFDEDGLPRTTQYLCDFTECRHIDGTCIAMLDVLCGYLTQLSCSIAFEAADALPAVLQKQLAWLFDTQSHTYSAGPVQGRLWQIHRVPVTSYETWLTRVFNNWMARKLYTSSLLVEPQTQCLNGLLENVQRHAGVSHMTVLFAWDEGLEGITFVVADAGSGIPTSIRRVWQSPCSDEVALVKAIELGRQPADCTPRSAGGLEQLLHAIVDRQIGKVGIASAFGRLLCKMGPSGKIYKFEPAHAYLPGTLVSVHFSTHEMRRSTMFNEPVARSSFVFKQV